MKAQRSGTRLTRNPFDYPRAYSVNPTKEELTRISELIRSSLETERPFILDPMAGGGSIPFEGLRVGAKVLTAEYNPVAYVILRATLEFPSRFGEKLADEISKWAMWINERARTSLGDFFPSEDQEVVLDYIWARTVKCPSCRLTAPLSPNWWLSKKKKAKERIAVLLQIPRQGQNDQVTLSIIDIRKHPSIDPKKGTITNANGSCPRCKDTIPEDYIKDEAQHGRMGHQLYAVVVKRRVGAKKWEKVFRSPTPQDLAAYERAVRLTDEGDYLGSDSIPTEAVPDGLKTREPLHYGMPTWDRFFNPRQLLTHATYLHFIKQAKVHILEEFPDDRDRATALITYLSMILDKYLNYNSLLSLWHPYHATIANTFDKHDFGFVWSYGEMNPVPVGDGGFDWATTQIVEAYKGLCKLLQDVDPSNLDVSLGSATNLPYVQTPVDAVIVDPPYYANVMYAELSDFFYVWMRRSLGDLYSGFDTPLTDKDGEVVANPARFKGLGVSAEEKAKEDYRTKMARTFKRVQQVLKPDGILVVMFTHKTTEAWDTLATALIDAGFQIKRSWPVRTESEHSLHIAKKNAVKSTILLVARKRRETERRGWWEQDVFPEIERVAAEKAAEFEQRGIEGVDLYISTFGPVLEVFSRYSEVKSMTGNPIKPEDALDVARKIVTERTFRSLVAEGGAGIDPETRFYILAMRFYKAREIPYDEAHKLAISVGVEAEELREDTPTRRRAGSKPRLLRTTKPRVRRDIMKKKGEFVKILEASEREHTGHIDLANPSTKPLINAIHLAELAFHRGGMKAYRRLAEQIGLDTNPDFQAAMKALEKALPEADPEKKALASLLVSPIELRSKGTRIDEYAQST
jgi:adenine-specific DNA methylase